MILHSLTPIHTLGFNDYLGKIIIGKIYQKYQSKLANRLHFIKDIELNFNLNEIPETLFSRMSCISHFKGIVK